MTAKGTHRNGGSTPDRRFKVQVRCSLPCNRSSKTALPLTKCHSRCPAASSPNSNPLPHQPHCVFCLTSPLPRPPPYSGQNPRTTGQFPATTVAFFLLYSAHSAWIDVAHHPSIRMWARRRTHARPGSRTPLHTGALPLPIVLQYVQA